MFGIVLIAVGLILAYAVNDTTDAVNLHLIGVILFVVGIISCLLEISYFSWFRRRWNDNADRWT